MHLATEYHRLVRKHNSLRKTKESLDTKDRLQKERQNYHKDQWLFAKKLFNDSEHTSIPPCCSVEEATAFFSETYSSANQEPISTPSWMSDQSNPKHLFDVSSISIEEIEFQIKKLRSGSAPCPFDQISYKIFKKCPSVLPIFSIIFNKCLYQSSIPNAWKIGVTRLLGKPAATKDSHNLSNFRPITLTSCMGKVFTSILKRRVLSYMGANNYLDTSIQKAFINNIPGCLEHQVKLSWAIQEAKSQQRSTVCWIDLANAFGSVDHNLILFALCHYHLPSVFINLIESFYTNLSVIISCRSWSTGKIAINIGIFQGDPLSVIIFNLVANLFVNYICNHYGHLGYTFTGSQRTLSLLQYADDSSLIADSIQNCQVMCTAAEKWLHWARMKAKVRKCRSFALVRGKPVSPSLYLNSLPVPPVGNEVIKFLGIPLSGTLSDDHQRHLLDKCSDLFNRVDCTFLSHRQKLKLYEIGICPRLHWDLMVIQLPITWVERHLDPLATSFLKKWSGLCRSASPSILYLSKEDGGLQLPAISTTFKKFHVSRMAQLLTSTDATVRFISSRMIEKERSTSGRAFLPALEVVNILQSSPGLSRQQLKHQSTDKVVHSDNYERLTHLQFLQVQGECFRLEVDTFNIWSLGLYSLPDMLFKFSLNAMVDCLPHNQNLLKWGKVQSGSCPLCGQLQSLQHILNSCPTALEQRRYNQWHDHILQLLVDFLQVHLPTEVRMTADLPNEDYYSHPFCLLDYKPDIIVWNPSLSEVFLFELTVCYDTNTSAAYAWKTRKYIELAETITETSSSSCLLHAMQVGSRGIIDLNSLRPALQLVKCPKRHIQQLLISIAITAITESFRIYSRRNIAD